jgi:hypothetical protein
MASFLLPKLLRAKNPIDLFVQVQDSLAGGFDLKGQIFIDEGMICQWTEPTQSFYEYRLIQAIDSDDLEQQVVRFVADEFDMFGNTVLWNGKRLQWMFRWVERESQRGVMATTGRLQSPLELSGYPELIEFIATSSRVPAELINDQPKLQFVTAVTPLSHRQVLGDI